MAVQPQFTSIVIGSDHGAVALKSEIVSFLARFKLPVDDVGVHDATPVDYPDIAVEVCKRVLGKQGALGIVFCGTGIGVSISANKVHGIRAALCHDHYTATMARQHNNANVMCAGARTTGPEVIKEMISAFIATPFEGGRHAARVNKINVLDSASSL